MSKIEKKNNYIKNDTISNVSQLKNLYFLRFENVINKLKLFYIKLNWEYFCNVNPETFKIINISKIGTPI